ncbi:hypothetical protein H9Q09_00790 [Aurantimonas sp. DM33-3]|uniref:hypothetical protein n=1 Tax=Aurantimonas sp. DM33-3 TaxID=2766955 RepID=UPI00165284FA|nr:hypothetical protein [Aurantimonas sp. DM33-3]MBC6714720.1 hypothetical protein [Aurantimonas sp. DM33-3]
MPEVIHRHTFPIREAMAALLGDQQIDADSYEIRVIDGCVVVDLVNPATVQQENRNEDRVQAGPTGQAADDQSDGVAPDAEDGPSQSPDAEGESAPEQQRAAEPELKGGARAKRAGMLCDDKGFQSFMDASSAKEVADALRLTCGVKTRAHLDHDEVAGQKFDEVVRRYGLWRQGYDV